MADDTPDPQKLLRLARQTMSSSERRRKYNKISFMDSNYWYPSQLKFFAAGSSGAHQRLIYGGNQSGKTLCCGAEVGGWHLTGQYPDWWMGHRFTKPVRAWAVGESSTLVRDSLQRQLCGPRLIKRQGDDEGDANGFGTGLVPLECFPRSPVMVPGGTGAIDTIFVTHMTDGKVDGTSELTFKSFEMRREKMQSESVDLIWIDERPSEDLYNELYARTFATNGHLLVSYTPIGEGAAAGVTYRFLSEPSADRAAFRIPTEEVLHISPERREELASGLPDHERETRMEGIPQLGTGPVFPVELLVAIVKRFNVDGPYAEVPPWAKLTVGIDFGYDHPFAAVLIAWDPQTGHVWVIDSFRMARSSALYHVQRIHAMTRGLRVPVAWPHDGAQHDKGSGIALKDQYKGFGANMMPTHAVNHNTKGNNIEPPLAEMRDAWYGGKFTIAPHNGELIEELRHYHRDEDFRIVKQRDDLISALRYAWMMRRHGKEQAACEGTGIGSHPYSGQRSERQGAQRVRGVNFNPWTGQSDDDDAA